MTGYLLLVSGDKT